jgi:hypothetical protein
MLSTSARLPTMFPLHLAACSQYHMRQRPVTSMVPTGPATHALVIAACAQRRLSERVAQESNMHWHESTVAASLSPATWGSVDQCLSICSTRHEQCWHQCKETMCNRSCAHMYMKALSFSSTISSQLDVYKMDATNRWHKVKLYSNWYASFSGPGKLVRCPIKCKCPELLLHRPWEQ